MKFLTRKLVTPADLNPRGYLHGGQLLKWIDEEGGIHAGLELNTGLIVTKMISEIDFRFPVILGDVVEIGMQTLDIGKSSCTLACDVRSLQADRIICSIDKMSDSIKASSTGKSSARRMALILEPMRDSTTSSNWLICKDLISEMYDLHLGAILLSSGP